MEKKILIVNVNWVGDVLFSTPFIRAVREAYPKSHIACLLHPRCLEVLEGSPRINELIIYDEEGAHKGLIGKLKLIASLRRKNFDVAFILHRSFTKALIARLAGIKERIGYPTKNRAILLTKTVEEPIDEPHKVEYFLNVARRTGITPRDRSYEFFIRDSDESYIKDLLKSYGVADKDLLIVLCPGGNWDMKRWPAANFARLADILAERFGAKIAIVGAKKDIGLAESIKGMMKVPPIIMCGRTTLKELGALLKRADLAIANDTGPMHIAVAMKTRVIALFGPTSPAITGPYGSGKYRVIYKDTGCEIPCYDVTCSDNRCMQAITVEDVFQTASNMLMQNDNRQIPS
ncbi:MAG: lipopolysaccharide heptosyltransferase II [Candidatus Omnitrophica bacterium]|nr:lipopolysaccharide heptosyltransferase II [Candidatus Omnitrophota bacterium]